MLGPHQLEEEEGNGSWHPRGCRVCSWHAAMMCRRGAGPGKGLAAHSREVGLGWGHSIVWCCCVWVLCALCSCCVGWDVWDRVDRSQLGFPVGNAGLALGRSGINLPGWNLGQMMRLQNWLMLWRRGGCACSGGTVTQPWGWLCADKHSAPGDTSLGPSSSPHCLAVVRAALNAHSSLMIGWVELLHRTEHHLLLPHPMAML